MHSIALILALAASAPLAGDLGALEVRSLPGTEVLWEGISLGTTDGEGRLLIEKIPFGRYQVRLRKEGHVAKSVEVEVGAGAATRLHLTLQKVAPPKPPPRPAIRQEPPQPKPEPPPARVLEAVREPNPAPKAVAEPELDATRSSEPTPPAEALAAAADSEPAPPGNRRGFPVTPTLLVAALLAGGMGLFLARRRPQPVPLRRPAPGRGPATPDPETISPSDDDPNFIETLRQQEKDLHDGEPGSWRREPEIIDAEFIEVLETNEE